MRAGELSRAAATLTVIALAAATTTTVVTATRVLSAERKQREGTTPRLKGDYLLVLGAQVLPHGPSNELRARLDHAVTRWREKAAPVVAVTGGTDGDLDEALIMADYLVSRGVPSQAVLRIVPGENTRASMRSMAQAAPGATVLAVSSPYHAHRVVTEGRRCGLDITADCPARTPESENPDIRRTRLFGETIGSVLYASPEIVVAMARRVSVPIRHRLPRRVASLGQKLRRRR